MRHAKSSTSRRQRGFTLVELMITVAIIGILASIAIPTFMRYTAKGKYTEAELALQGMMSRVRMYAYARGSLPPTTSLMPTTTACASKTGLTPLTLQSDWLKDPGWKALEYHVDQPGYFQYQFQNLGKSTGMVQAIGDVDCDGASGSLFLMLTMSQGSMSSVRFDFLAAD